jgi:hypothetical protein
MEAYIWREMGLRFFIVFDDTINIHPDRIRGSITVMAHEAGCNPQDPSGKTIAPWTFDMKFPFGTQFTFGSLTFAVGEDRDLKMLPQGQRQSIPLLLPHLHQAVPT